MYDLKLWKYDVAKYLQTQTSLAKYVCNIVSYYFSSDYGLSKKLSYDSLAISVFCYQSVDKKTNQYNQKSTYIGESGIDRNP